MPCLHAMVILGKEDYINWIIALTFIARKILKMHMQLLLTTPMWELVGYTKLSVGV